MHTGNEWKKVAVKAGAGLAAIVCGRSFEKEDIQCRNCLFHVCEREGGDGLTFFAAVV